MSMKAILVTAAGVLAVTPAFALTNSQIVHHSGGPIPYSQLSSSDRTGYNVRSHKTHAAAATSTAASPDAPAPSATTDSSAATPAPAPADAPAAGASTSLPPATTTTPSNPAATVPPSGQPQ